MSLLTSTQRPIPEGESSPTQTLVGKCSSVANRNWLPLANMWFASAHIASGNSLPLANIMFASGKCDTTGEPVTCSPTVSAIPLANKNLYASNTYFCFYLKIEIHITGEQEPGSPVVSPGNTAGEYATGSPVVSYLSMANLLFASGKLLPLAI